MEPYTTGTGQKLYVHESDICENQYCSIHNPSPHHMKDWKTHWREDRHLMERLCPHGIGHPDPDHINHLPLDRQRWESIHGCDGCCSGKNDDI